MGSQIRKTLIVISGLSLSHNPMIAEIAGKLVAKYIDSQWPSDKEHIYETLRLGLNKAWAEGRFLGMTKEFFVKVYKDAQGQNYIVAPQSHPSLLAINVLGKPASIQDSYFMFHRNGYGDVRDSPACKWNRDVYSIGNVPYLNKNNINFSEGVRIGVRPIGTPGKGEKVYISGSYSDGNAVYTYKSKTEASCCGCSVNPDDVVTVRGAEVEIGNGFTYINNIIFTSIDKITKTVTRTPIEIIAIQQDGSGQLIARMEPGVRFSEYRMYLVPNELCGKTSLHAIFKIAQQEKITSDTDSLLIDNEEVLISLAKCIHFTYTKEQPDVGAGYFLQAISMLDKEKREEEPAIENHIQVESIYEGDLGVLKL